MVQNRNESLITDLDPKSPIAEAYRVLRTNIQFTAPDRELKVIMITSAGPSEGKSTTLANLAVATAQSGARVALVDCDLRKPVMHHFFGKSNRVGVTSVLMGQETLEAAFQTTQRDNLSLLASGPVPPNPSELLASKRMKELIANLKGQFDYVFMDAPPSLAVTDAAVLSQMVDGVLLMAASNQTHRDALVSAKGQLDKVKANILGVVLNKVKVDSTYQSYYYYYYSSESETAS